MKFLMPGRHIMIDGKIIYLSGQQLSNLLNGKSSDYLGHIQTINKPGAELHVAGIAGQINIITKKNSVQGKWIVLRRN
ncbi:hypothetical protein [Chitinophaga sp. LS1]|uniref:hypothetical protein n=1 Tax=Chitinophaga sp. LS1 TaxID=3051176 RepID=UPI002AABBD57|nr:hypothetical protein [Chitinophaga sp. LS1]WPV64597.1 hypothetical protein QQL36_22605 [Chitinophaga sp. LS1]